MSRRDPRQIIIHIFITLVAIFIVGYSIYQARNLIGGPEINITSPQNGATLTDPFVEIKGTTENIVSISLNDRPIFVDKQGAFSEKILLVSGYNILKVTVKDKFGRSVEKRLELVLDK